MATQPPPPPNPYAVELALAAALQQISDQQDAQIVQAWAKAWGSVAEELLDTLTVVLADAGRVSAHAVVRYRRLANVLGAMADHLDEATQALGVTITSSLRDVVERAEAGTRELIAAQGLLKDKTLPVRRVPTPALSAIVRRTTEQVTSQLQPLADDTYTVILRELTKGTAAGDNPRETARQMVARAENLHNFGRSRALNIARTEMLDAYRAGAQETEQQYTDVLAGWLWVAHLGPRTCRSCLSMHGRMFDLDVAGPHDHQQGRCSRVSVVREEDGSIDTSWLPDAEEHFAQLPEEDQRAILGRAGYAAWKRGEFPISSWAKAQSNPGWRDSVVPAKPGEVSHVDASTSAGGGGGKDSGGGSAAPPAEPDGIGSHVTIVDEETRETVDAAAAVIDQAHRVPADMATIEARVMSETTQTAFPDAAGIYYHLPLSTPTLELRPPADSVHRQYVTIHELGHALDDLVFGDGLSNGTNGTRTKLAEELAPWWAAVEESRAYRTLGEMAAWDAATQGPWVTIISPSGKTTPWDPEDDYLDYLMRPTELFARAYAQWVVQQAGTPSHRFALELDMGKTPAGFAVLPAGRQANYPTQWTPDDFEAIAEQLRLLFAGRGLIPGETP